MTDRNERELDDGTIQRMLDAARNAATRAYAPYSSFPVGAAVLTSGGQIVAGANVENASYGLTVCGERTAVFRAVVEGHRVLRAVVVSASNAPGATPCGACRQVLNEFKPADADLLVILDRGRDVSPRTVPLDRLLPESFGPNDLKVSGDTSHTQ